MPSRYGRRFDRGFFRAKNTLLYVNEGIGGRHPALRLPTRDQPICAEGGGRSPAGELDVIDAAAVMPPRFGRALDVVIRFESSAAARGPRGTALKACLCNQINTRRL